MSLDILEHPTVERLILGETVGVQELREALVEFWQENDTFSLCGNCPVSYQTSAVGCCSSCVYHDIAKGCTLRNLACLMHTCGSLERKLKSEGLWESFEWFAKMMYRGLHEQEPYFSRRRLPDKAQLHLVQDCSGPQPLSIRTVDDIQGEKTPGHRDMPWVPLLDKIGQSGIRCRVSPILYKEIKEKYPDSPVYVDEEQASQHRRTG